MLDFNKHFVVSAIIISLLVCFSSGYADDDSRFAGRKTSLDDLPEIEIAHGVTANLIWGDGCLVSIVTMQPGAMVYEEELPAERIMIVMNGKVSQLMNDGYEPMTGYDYETMTPISGHRGRHDFVYHEKGGSNALKAGNFGAHIIEVYSPPRKDYLEKAGVDVSALTFPEPSVAAEPSVEPERVYNYFDIQFTDITDGGFSRLISGKYSQMSFLRMIPGSSYANSSHDAEQITIVMRGERAVTSGDDEYVMAEGDATYIPGGKEHGAVMGDTGSDVLDVFYPVRRSFRENERAMYDDYHAIIPPEAEVELVLDGGIEGPGLCFIEGPTWLYGKLYFSSMHYDDVWNGGPKRSATIVMEPDGSYRYLQHGDMETNGTFALENGNLAVCDMFGHRVVEMDTSGAVVRVIAAECDGKRLDGPNDLVVDLKGGVYFTDPQILPEPHMQPGRSVIYASPDGETMRVVEPGVLIKPNGLILSPDGATLYVNSTHEDFMMAYDVNDDGSLSNGRKFGKLKITPEFLDQESINTQADGMTVDEHGNVYITSILGLQIFKPNGDYIGTIHYPEMPVNCCFGGDDGTTLFTTCNDKVFKIETNVRGAEYTLR